MEMLKDIIAKVAMTLSKWNIPERQSMLIAQIAIYGICIYGICSVVVLIGRIQKKIKPIYTITDKIILTLVASVLLGTMSWMWYWSIKLSPRNFAKLFYEMTLWKIIWGSWFQKLDVLIGLVIIIPILCFCLAICFVYVQEEIEANGMLKGILLSIYDLFAGLFWLALVLLAFCGIGAIIGLITLVALGMSSDSGYEIVDEDGRHWYIR